MERSEKRNNVKEEGVMDIARTLTYIFGAAAKFAHYF